MILTSSAVPADHPGAFDPEYWRRRAAIAAASEATGVDAPPPTIDYAPDEQSTWRTVATALGALHARFAVAEYRRGAAALSLPVDRVPQLAEVSARLGALTGWSLAAVPGLVPPRTFYESLARRRFLSTQYVRHPSVPFYTPEPDIIHELIGHANALASPRFAELYAAAGEASRRATDDERLRRFSQVFWFTIEFGVAVEDGELRTYGAGLLSSFGEIQAFRDAQMRPFDIEAMATTGYDISRFQDVLFCAPSFDEAESKLLDFFAAF